MTRIDSHWMHPKTWNFAKVVRRRGWLRQCWSLVSEWEAIYKLFTVCHGGLFNIYIGFAQGREGMGLGEEG